MPKTGTTKQPDVGDYFDNFNFPSAGIDLSMPVSRQPARQIAQEKWAKTTPLGINVRVFEASTGQMKGGSRSGLSRWVNEQVNGTRLIQGINVLVGTGYTAPGGVVQTSQSGRVVTLVVVSGGTVKVANAGATSYTSVTDGTAALNTSGIVFSAPNNQKLYFVDGTNWKYYDPSTNAMYAWVATRGSLPVDGAGNAPRLICTWRGRTLLAGLLNSPQALFGSAVRDPTDFEYSGQLVEGALETTANQAFSLTLGSFGDTGDVITCLIPFNDDIAIVGMDHTIRILRGDPMAGGDIGLISDGIGMAWGAAWCKDPYGNIYFVSNRTAIYRLTPGQPPQRISQGIDPLLQEINTGTNTISLAWDDGEQSLHVWITPTAAAAATKHYALEARVGALWQDVYANKNHNPLCCCTFDGNLPEDRVTLIGSWDGFVRKLDRDATTDHHTLIESSVLIGAIVSKTFDNLRLKELVPEFATNSGGVNYEVFVGTSAQEALDSEPVETGVWQAGRNDATPVRRDGHALYLGMNSTNQWAMERIRGKLAATGPVGARSR